MSTGNFTLDVSPDLLIGLLVGATVQVSEFPMHKGVPGFENQMQEDPGKYFVDSVVMHASGKMEIGIADAETQEHIDYFEHDQLRLTVVSKGRFWVSAS